MGRQSEPCMHRKLQQSQNGRSTGAGEEIGPEGLEGWRDRGSRLDAPSILLQFNRISLATAWGIGGRGKDGGEETIRRLPQLSRGENDGGDGRKSSVSA